MKASELRVGSLVEYKGVVYPIYGLSEEAPFLDTIEFGSGVLEWKDINPVPITEDWLLRFGFNYDANDDWYVLDCGTGVSFSHIIDGLTHYFSSLEMVWADVLQEIKYVHQFQNLHFALTGEELEVKG
jgi:hypothetical protein